MSDCDCCPVSGPGRQRACAARRPFDEVLEAERDEGCICSCHDPIDTIDEDEEDHTADLLAPDLGGEG